MPAAFVMDVLGALAANGVRATVSGGWAVDALLGEQTRVHADLDLWVDAEDADRLIVALVDLGIDRLCPWPGDRPWNFVVHDGGGRRVDLHFYERLADGRLHFGGVRAQFRFDEADLSGRGAIGGRTVTCERPEFALANHTGYEPRASDRLDVERLCERFGLERPAAYR